MPSKNFTATSTSAIVEVMDLLDWGIIALLLAALVRGLDVGMMRQLFSSVGLVGGILLGALVEGKLAHAGQQTPSWALLAFVVTLSFGALFLTLGEYVGLLIKL